MNSINEYTAPAIVLELYTSTLRPIFKYSLFSYFFFFLNNFLYFLRSVFRPKFALTLSSYIFLSFFLSYADAENMYSSDRTYTVNAVDCWKWQRRRRRRDVRYRYFCRLLARAHTPKINSLHVPISQRTQICDYLLFTNFVVFSAIVIRCTSILQRQERILFKYPIFM